MHKAPFNVRYGKRYDLSVFSSMISDLPMNLFSLLKKSLDMLQARGQLRPCRLLSTVIQYIASACKEAEISVHFSTILQVSRSLQLPLYACVKL